MTFVVRRSLENTVDITAKQYKEERDQLAEQMNQLSEALLGYREGSHFDLITRANHLKLKSQNVEIANQYREIADAISDLKQLSDDVMGDA